MHAIRANTELTESLERLLPTPFFQNTPRVIRGNWSDYFEVEILDLHPPMGILRRHL